MKTHILAVSFLIVASGWVRAESFGYARSLSAAENWFTPYTWFLNEAAASWVNPVSPDTASASIQTSGETPLVFTLDGEVALNALSLSGTADLTLSGSPLTIASPSALDFTGRTLTIASDLTLTTQNKGAAWDCEGTLALLGNNTITGPTVSLAIKNGTLLIPSGETTITGQNLIFTGSSARLILEGTGKLTVPSIISRGGTFDPETGAKGAIIIRDNATLITTASALFAAPNDSYGDGSSNTQIDIFQSGGRVELRGTEIRIGHHSSAEGTTTYMLSGGDLVVPNAPLTVGRLSPALLEMTGGTLEANGIIVVQSTGQTPIYPAHAALNGGTVTLGASGILTSAGSPKDLSSIGFGAATLTSKASWALSTITNAALTSAEGTRFAPAAGHTITLSSALSGTGKLIVDGEGSLRLNAEHTYSGETELKAGTLLISTSAYFSAASPLTLNGGTLDLAIGNPITTPALTIGETNTVLAVTFSVLPDGSYPIIYASTVSGSMSNIELSVTAPAAIEGTVYALAVRDNTVYLDATPPVKKLTWALQSGTWSTLTTDLCWSQPDDTIAYFSNGDITFFRDLAESPEIAVTVANAVNTPSMTFTNSVSAYTFTGGEGASIAAEVLTAAAGSIATFGVPVTPAAFTLAENAAFTFNAGLGSVTENTATYSNNLLLPEGASLGLASDGLTQVLSGVFTGNGRIAQGGGMIAISDRWPQFSGQVILTGGSLRLDAGSSGGLGTFSNSAYNSAAYYPIIASGGAEVILNANEATGWNTGQGGCCFIDLKEDAKLRIVTGSEQNILKKLRFSGDASVVNESATTQVYLNARGSIWVTTGTATFDVLAGAKNFGLTKGASDSALYRMDVLDNAKLVFTTPLIGSSGGIQKTSAGTLQFNQGVTHSRPMVIEQGTLVLNGASSGSPAITIGVDGGTTAILRGSGSITGTAANVRVNPDSAVLTEGLTLPALTLANGARLIVGSELSPVIVTGTYAASGTIAIDLSEIDTSTYSGKITDIITWTGAAPEGVSYALPEGSGVELRLVESENALALYRISGTRIMLY